jgi:L-lactate dehydrogenase (cytochrome)
VSVLEVLHLHVLKLVSLGTVDMSTVKKVEVEVTSAEKARLERVSRVPPLSEILNLHDFEVGLLTCARNIN